MKKLSWLLFLNFVLIGAAIAQPDLKTYSQSVTERAPEHKGKIGIMALIPMEDNYFWSLSEPSVFRNQLQADSAFSKARPKEFVSITTFDTTKAQFLLFGVNKNNSADYEYRVMEDLYKTLIPWSAVKIAGNAAVKGLFPKNDLTWLGGYHTTYGSMIVVDIRNKQTGQIIATAVVKWVPIIPAVQNVYTPDQLNDFLAMLKHPWTLHDKQFSGSQELNYTIDPITKLPMFKAGDNNLIFYLNSDVVDKNLIEYALVKGETVVQEWTKNEFDNPFVWLKNLEPGKYYLKVRFQAQREHVMSYAFGIKAAWYQTGRFYFIIGFLSVFFIAAIAFLFIIVRQRKRAAEELAKKTKLQLELRAIHSQLNPHFVFNALSSIQGLINKNDIKGANSYLADFAQLLRNSLSNSDREQSPLQEEIKTLETYLKLEQLRFGFQYEISLSDRINASETEIPALLLQPLMENSIKHGISGLGEAGRISLAIDKVNTDMNITLKDNGKGFILTDSINGLGLKLTRDRIKLLNEVMPGRSINLDIDAAAGKPTVIHLSFKNWFDEN